MNILLTNDAVVVHNVKVEHSHGAPDSQQSQDHEPGQQGVLRTSSYTLCLLPILALHWRLFPLWVGENIQVKVLIPHPSQTRISSKMLD